MSALQRIGLCHGLESGLPVIERASKKALFLPVLEEGSSFDVTGLADVKLNNKLGMHYINEEINVYYVKRQRARRPVGFIHRDSLICVAQRSLYSPLNLKRYYIYINNI